MNLRSLRLRVCAASLAACVLSLALRAQVAPTAGLASAASRTASAASAADDAVIELSPFVIDESKKTGWVATQTLGGSRRSSLNFNQPILRGKFALRAAVLLDKSVASRSAAVDFPDFTRGKWKAAAPLRLMRV